MRMAVSDSGSQPFAFRRSKVSLRESPASTRRRVLSVATSVQLPALEDARTETLTMRGPPLELTITIALLTSEMTTPDGRGSIERRKELGRKVGTDHSVHAAMA